MSNKMFNALMMVVVSLMIVVCTIVITNDYDRGVVLNVCVVIIGFIMMFVVEYFSGKDEES